MRVIPFGLLAVAAGAPAFAQSINIDVGFNVTYPLPASTFGAGAVQPGVWNDVTGQTSTPQPLVDLQGNPIIPEIYRFGINGTFDFNNPLTSGNDQNLMDDCYDPGTLQASYWFVTDLDPGQYRVYTYGMAPDSASYRTNVSVLNSPDPLQVVGGAWPGGYVQGITHAMHHVTINAGDTLQITVQITATQGLATLDGFQIVKETPPPSTFCVPGQSGVMACVCSNPNGAGRGCANSGGPGATISFNGSPSVSNDTFQLTGSSMFSGDTCIFLEGDGVTSGGAPFFSGIRCVNGLLIRMYVKGGLNTSGGTSTAPVAGDMSISARCASNFPASTITPGQTRYFQIYYRDPNAAAPTGSCPSINQANATNGLQATWLP